MKAILFLTFATFLLLQCNSSSEGSSAVSKEATLEWTGPLAADGCGYFLTIDDERIKPVNDEDIPEEFQQTGSAVPVSVTYEVLNEPQVYSCGMMGTQYDASVRIISVKMR
jgi:hypothetical protein